MFPDQETVIADDGLRYESKVGGSLFCTAPCGTMSCIVCGHHRPRSTLKPFKLAGRQYYRCEQPCAKPS